MLMSDSIANIAKALSSFQSEVKQPSKDGNNPHFRSSYVTLDSVIDTINKIAPKFGISYTQMPITNQSGTGVITMIMHESGEYIQFDPMVLPMDKQTSQGAGSAMTYARRYSLSAAFGIASDVDDDGEATMGRGNSYQPPKTNNNTQPSQNNKPIGGYTKTVKPTNAQEAAAIVMSGGKHAGKTLKEVFTTDKSYVKWMLESEKTDPNIKEGIELMQVAIAQQNAAKSMNQ